MIILCIHHFFILDCIYYCKLTNAMYYFQDSINQLGGITVLFPILSLLDEYHTKDLGIKSPCSDIEGTSNNSERGFFITNKANEPYDFCQAGSRNGDDSLESTFERYKFHLHLLDQYWARNSCEITLDTEIRSPTSLDKSFFAQSTSQLYSPSVAELQLVNLSVMARDNNFIFSSRFNAG